MKKFFGILFIFFGIYLLIRMPNLGKDIAYTLGALIGISICSFIPAFFLLRNANRETQKESTLPYKESTRSSNSVSEKRDAGVIVGDFPTEQQARDITIEAIKEIITESVSEKGMDGLVDMLNTTFALNKEHCVVTHNGNELIINMLEPSLVKQYYEAQEVIKNTHLYSYSDVSMAKSFMLILRESDIKNIKAQNSEDRSLFIKSGVKKYTSKIDGNLISSINYDSYKQEPEVASYNAYTLSGVLINSRFRELAKANNCAPTEKTTNNKISEIYEQVGIAFRETAKERREIIKAEYINFIVFKFIQVYELLGDEGLHAHLKYEIEKYRREGLREDYKQEIKVI